MLKILRFIFSMILIVSLTGCHPTRANITLPKADADKVSTHANVATYIDGSFSMLGYANFPVDSEYATALKDIEQALNVAWKESTVHYYRFGEQTIELDRDTFLTASTAAFYHDNVTALNSVIDTLDPNKVNILVTDLFQTDQDIQGIINVVKSRFFTQNKIVAILGMKSRYDGEVYDIGNNRMQFHYTSTDKTESFRPFYYIVLGPSADVKHFLNSYLSVLPASMEHKLLVYDTKLSDSGKLAVSSQAPENGLRSFAATNSLLPADAPYMQFLLKDHPGVINFTYQSNLPYQVKSDNISFIADSLEVWQEGKFNAVKDQAFSKTKVLSVQQVSKKTTFNVQLQCDPSKLPSKGIYRMHMVLGPSRNQYCKAQNNALSTWNMDASDTSTWQDNAFPGNTTFNLTKFTNSLAEIAYVYLKPAYASTWIYFSL